MTILCPAHQSSHVAIYQGDALTVLRELPGESVQCVITSPPYWGLRDYGVDGQLGMEKTPEEYVARMVEVFREVRRVLRKDGTLFLNIGDSYFGSGKGPTGFNGIGNQEKRQGFSAAPIRNERPCDTSGKVPEDCPLHDSIWNRPCDGCRAVSILRTFYNGQCPSDGGDPNREHMESENVRSPKSRSSLQKQTRQSSDAIRDLPQTQVHEGEPPLSSQGSKVRASWRRDRAVCAPVTRVSAGPEVAGTSSLDVLGSAHSVRDDRNDTGTRIFSSGGRTSGMVHNVCPYLHYTTAFHDVKWKSKDLVGIPWRVAFALQADGWWLRSEIIWAKPNPMPESVTDRPTKAHEQIFLMAKSGNYFYDQGAVREPHSTWENRGGVMVHTTGGNRLDGLGTQHLNAGERPMTVAGAHPAGRNLRSVWTIATQPYPEAHFATFPEKLVEPCIKAGSSERGCCPKCGSPWERVVEKTGGTIGKSWHDHSADIEKGQMQGTYRRLGGYVGDLEEQKYKVITTGWRPTCTCEAGESQSCTILDPFAGSGTVGLVAQNLGRKAILIELKGEYVEMIKKRIKQEGLML